MTDYKIPNNRIRNGFLDNKPNAREFYIEKLERAEELLTNLFMVTSGVFVPPNDDKDWGHKITLEVLEFFLIRHENFSRSDFAEDLQERIFRQTMTYFDNYNQWRAKTFADRGLDDDGEPLPKTREITQKENVLDLSNHPPAEGECLHSKN
jgi:hypothetical protein